MQVGGAQSDESGVDQKGRWTFLLIVSLVYACHHLDRTILFSLAEPIRQEFGLTDAQTGALGGLAYGLAFAVAALPIGFLVDRTDRRRLLGAAAITWSALTALTGFAQNYVMLLLARFGVGVAEAAGAPASLSLITDLFSPKRRSLAIGVFYSSLALGGLGTALITAHIATELGWRSAFFVAGIPGAILGLVLLVMLKEPKRGASEPDRAPADGSPRPRVLATLSLLFSRAAYVHILIGATLTVAATACMGVWFTAFLMRYHNIELGQAAGYLGLAYGLFAALGSLVGGALGDWTGAKHPHRRLLAPMVALISAAPLACFALISSNTAVVIAILVVLPALFQGSLAPSFASALSSIPPEMRGAAAALLQLSTNFVGVGVGPALVGLGSDNFGLRESLIVATLITCAWGAVHYALAAASQARSTRASTDAAPAPA